MNKNQLADLPQNSLALYILGYVFSLILTLFPFILVINNDFSSTLQRNSVIISGVVQIIFQLIIFLHLKPTSSQYWRWLAFIYTFILLVILVGASVWIMYHLNQNM